MEKEKILAQFHLDKKEVLIYLAALELGPASATQIAEKAGIQRTYFYDLSRKLLALGFFKQIPRGKKQVFSAIDPEKLVAIQEEKISELKKIIPELKAVYNTLGQKPRISYYEGMEGIAHIMTDTRKKKGEFLAFSTPAFLERKNRVFSKEYVKKRVEIGNSMRLIAEMSNEYREVKVRDKEELRETRLLPYDLYHSNVVIGLYQNKMCVIDFRNDFGFIIESAEIASTMRMIFELVWGSGKVAE